MDSSTPAASPQETMENWFRSVIADFSQEAKIAPADAQRLALELTEIAQDYARRGRPMTDKDLELAKQAGNLVITQTVVRNLGHEDRAQTSALNLGFAMLLAFLTPGVDIAAL